MGIRWHHSRLAGPLAQHQVLRLRERRLDAALEGAWVGGIAVRLGLAHDGLAALQLSLEAAQLVQAARE